MRFRRDLRALGVLGGFVAVGLLGSAGASAQVSRYRLVRLVDTVVSNTDSTLFANDAFADWENSLAVNPQNPNHLVVLGFAEDSDTVTNIPLWHSVDGGRTWTKRFTIPSAGFGIPNDQTLDWGRNNELTFSFLTFDGNILSVMTEDPADTAAFTYRTDAIGQIQLTNHLEPGSLFGSDQPWVLTNRDPFNPNRDNVYVAYDDFNGTDGVEGTDIRVAVSYGSNPLDFTVDRQIGNATTFAYNPGLRLAKDKRTGAMYAVWGRCVANCGGDPQNMDFFMNRSADGGLNWSLNGQPFGIAIANANSTQPTPKFGGVNARLGGAQHAAVDSRTGAVYHVYANVDAATGNDRLAIRRLTVDGAGNATIGPEVIIANLETGIPQVAVDDAGTVGVFYYSFDGLSPAPDSRPIFTAHFALSDNQAATFTDRSLVTFVSPQADNGNSRQRVLGDYEQLKADGTCFYGAFTADGGAFGRPVANTDPIFFKICRSADVCLFASNRLGLGDRVRATAASGAGSFAEIGADGRVVGSLDVDGNALLRDRARVEGDVTLSGTLQTFGPFVITGTLTERSTNVLFPGLPVKVVVPGTAPLTIPNGAIRTLDPGSFGTVIFRAGSIVTLRPGVYNFASLNVEPGVRVTAAGTVEINVQGQVNIGDRARIIAAAPGNLSLYTNASDLRIGTDVIFTGVVVGPGARVGVASRTQIQGCVGGRDVAFEPDVIIDSLGATLPAASPTSPSCNDGLRNGNETDVDCGGPACADCANGQRCTVGSDCTSGTCFGGTCQSAGNLSATLNVTADWGGGYCVGLRVTNTAAQPTTSWTVNVDTNQSTIYTSWNGIFSGVSGAVSVVPAFSWNQSIPAGGTNDSVGFCANRTVAGSGVLPTIVSASGNF